MEGCVLPQGSQGCKVRNPAQGMQSHMLRLPGTQHRIRSKDVDIVQASVLHSVLRASEHKRPTQRFLFQGKGIPLCAPRSPTASQDKLQLHSSPLWCFFFADPACKSYMAHGTYQVRSSMRKD